MNSYDLYKKPKRYCTKLGTGYLDLIFVKHMI